MKIILSIMLFLLCQFALAAHNTVKIAVRTDFSLSKEYEQTLSRAYRLINQPVEFVYMPGGSSLKYSNTEELGINGEAGRLEGVLKTYSNLRKVNVPIYHSELSVFTSNKDLKITGWQDLKKLQSTTRIGFKVVIDKMKGMNLKVVKDTDTALKLVAKGRADVAVLPRGDGLQAIEELGLNNIFVLGKPLERYPVFHMLHKSHEDLIPRLEAALKSMEKEIVLTTGITMPLAGDGSHTGYVEDILVEAFRRAGYHARIKKVPAKLSLLNANSGVDDGVAFRIKGINKTYQNLIRVPEVIICSEFTAYSKKPFSSFTSWDSLSGYDVSYMNGWRIFEENLKKNRGIRKVENPQTLFKMLKMDRTEIVLYEKWQGLAMAKNAGLDQLYVSNLPLKQKNMYAYLNKKHKGMVIKIARQLKAMKKDGTYQALFEKNITRYLGKDDASKGYFEHTLKGCQQRQPE